MKIKTLEVVDIKEKIHKTKNNIFNFKTELDDTLSIFNKNIRVIGSFKLENELNRLKNQLNKTQEEISRLINISIININTYADKNFDDIKRYHLIQEIKHLRKHEQEIKQTTDKIIKLQSDNLRLHQKLKYIELNKDEASVIKNNIDSLNERFDNILSGIR